VCRYTERSLWLVSNGFVYDATLFMHDHPVGPLPMLRGAGRDNTEVGLCRLNQVDP
jgi:cytochrome b involved in lipid metabolism